MRMLSLVACRVLRGTGDDGAVSGSICRVLRGTGDEGAVSGSMPGTAWYR